MPISMLRFLFALRAWQPLRGSGIVRRIAPAVFSCRSRLAAGAGEADLSHKVGLRLGSHSQRNDIVKLADGLHFSSSVTHNMHFAFSKFNSIALKVEATRACLVLTLLVMKHSMLEAATTALTGIERTCRCGCLHE